jgi:hypothetical protein
VSRDSICLLLWLLSLRVVFCRDSISLLRLLVGLGRLLRIGIGRLLLVGLLGLWISLGRLLLVGLLGLGIGSRLIYRRSSSCSPVVLGLMHVDTTGGRGLGFAVVEKGEDYNWS